MSEDRGSGAPVQLSPERCAAFIDAAVAIALTLLILPLMESVADAGDEHAPTAARWFAEHDDQLISFVISFVMIMLFWMIHHRLFRLVVAVPTGLMWIVAAWLLTIVWLPVATSMSGAFGDGDTLTRVVYIGSLTLVCVMSFVIRCYVRAHPEITHEDRARVTEGLTVDGSMILLFVVALVIAAVFPAIGYWGLLVLWLSGLVQAVLRRLGGRAARRR